MNFKRTALSVIVGTIAFGVNYTPVEDLDNNPASFLSGISWGKTANASEQCYTELGGECENITIIYEPPPEFWYPDPNYGYPDCYPNCSGGGGGGGPSSSTGSNDPLTASEIAEMSEYYGHMLAILNESLERGTFKVEERNKILNMISELSQLVDTLSLVDELSGEDLVSLLSHMSAHTVSIILGVAITTVSAAAIAAAIGTSTAALPAVIAGFAIAEMSLIVMDYYGWNDSIAAYFENLYSDLYGWYVDLTPPEFIDPKDEDPYCDLAGWIGVPQPGCIIK
ncbi:hypothetical protein Ga0003345_0577 [Idiomarinaceae bacterium HL-53]|nr:hypothetical protein Ga0003345_0577 [Idiomarinaceae bacterium HL-53]